MTKEEKNLRKRCGSHNPYTVPEGYFEGFAARMMEQLPEKEFREAPKVTTWQRVKPWVYMAAMFCGLMLSVRVFVGESPKTDAETTDVSELADEYIDGIINETMMDDYTLYQYLTDANSKIYY